MTCCVWPFAFKFLCRTLVLRRHSATAMAPASAEPLLAAVEDEDVTAFLALGARNVRSRNVQLHGCMRTSLLSPHAQAARSDSYHFEEVAQTLSEKQKLRLSSALLARVRRARLCVARQHASHRASCARQVHAAVMVVLTPSPEPQEGEEEEEEDEKACAAEQAHACRPRRRFMRARTQASTQRALSFSCLGAGYGSGGAERRGGAVVCARVCL